MAAILEDHLRKLHEIYSVSGASTRDQIDDFIKDIRHICLNEILERDKDLCCSTLFDQSFGIVSFLEKIVAQDEFQSSKAGLLELISEFTQKVEKKVLPFALDIKEICMSAYNRDKSAKVKNAAIAALAKVLELTVGSTLGEIMKIEKMIDKFMMELTKSSKLTATVKGSIYTLLGVITEVYPEYATVYSERLAGLYVNALKAEMTSKTKKPELSIIAGCLQGLTAFLVNFTQSVDEDSKYSYEIFKYARMAIDPSVEFTKYDVPRAGLHLFARHAGQFSEYLVDDYQNMYEKLQKWSHHHNRDVLHLGVSAMEAFLKQVSSTITERAKSRGNREGAIFKFFLQEFRDTMNNPSATLKEISLAVKGYGLLAAPCRIFLTQADVQFMFGEMMTKCEQEFLNTAQFVDEKLLSFPGFLHAVANIVKEISEVPETYALTLEQLLVVLLENLPKIHRPYHFTSLKAILYLLLSLQGKGNTFSKVLAGFVYQGLIRSCSHPVVIETQEQQSENSDETDLTVKPVTYRDFLELWSGLLESPSIKDFAKDDIGIEERRQLTQDLYDELMTAILKVIGKLDLSAIAREKEGELTSIQEEREGDNKDRPSANPLEGVEPSRPMDFQVFINLVDFCRDLLVQKHFQLFEKWVFTFTHTIIVHSTRFPLVSGFYKLLAVTMHIASELDFFKFVSASPATEIKNEMQMEEDGDGGDLSQVTYLLVSKFTKEVLVRMKQYRDDLLASCLTLIMALPKEIVAQQIKNIVPAIQLTFSMGLSYLPLAQIGLDALKRWSQMLPSEVLAPHYSSILPCLDSYLRTSDTGAEEVKIETVATASSKTSRRRKKLPIRIVRERKQLDTDKFVSSFRILREHHSYKRGYESQLSLVKQRILTYLGSLGGSVNYALLAGNEDEISRRAIAWDTYQHLRFDVPFRDIKPTIYFDPFLPRVVELARKSSDRQTKVAACELLHSLTLYTLGRTAQQPGDQQKLHSVENLYRKLFPALLSLACDVEQVCRQLFEPLVMQLIHWFTGNKMGESPETMALLDSMYDGLIQQEDTMLRDFSAQCLREFLTWSIKQTSRKSIEKNPVNVKSVLKRMFSYALHPSAFKRLGAALAFNSFYTVLREEDSLVDRFTFHILVHFVESLSIAHGDEKSLGTQEQCKKALENLERIIRQKADILRKQTGSRKEPAEWSKQTLDIAVRWLVRQCGRPQTECRHACMKLVYRLASLITGIKSPQEYFTAFLTAENGAYFVIRFEGGGHTGQEKGGLLKFPTLDRTAERFSLQNVLIWCDTVLAALDCYCWVFGEELLSPESVFTDYKEKSSCLFESLIYFVEKLALGDLHDAARQFPGLPDSFFFTPRELDDYNRAKCTLIVRIWNFLTVLLAKYTQKAHKVIPHKLLSKTLWKLCVSCVLKPSSVGFNMGDIEITMNLPKEMIQVLRVLSKCLPDFQKKELLQTLGQELQQHDRDVFGQLPVLYAEAKTHYMEFKQTVEGYSQLHSVGLLLPAIGKSGCHEKLAKDLFDCVFQGITKKNDGKLSVISLNPAAQSLASCLLDFSFQLKLQPEDLVKSLLDSTPVHGLGQGVEHSWGDRFFLLFKSNVSSHLASNPQIIAHLMRYTDREPHRVCSILATMLDHMAHDRDLRKMQGQKIVQEIVSHWEKLKPWWETGSTVYHHGLLVLLLTKLLIIDSKVMINVGNPSFDLVLAMYRSLLTDKKTNLAFKNRVLDLLPFFAAVPKPHEDKLRESLDRFVADNFPLKSSELARGTPTYNDYITSIDKLLSALELSDSLMLLELLISVFCREEGRHAHQDAIQESLANFICRLPGDKQKPALEVPFKIFCSEGSFSSSIRRATIEQACLPIMHIICKAALIEFFLDNIIHLMSIVDVKLSKGPESVLESQLTSKLCCFQLLEVMYSRLSREEVNSQESEINRRACFGKPETGKEMTQKITKTVSEAKSEDVRGETMLVELRRQYHCYSYNLLMAIICCVQNDSKFYKGFLFQDNVAKGQFLLDNIIDKDKKYEFPMEFESRFERKKKFVAIRNKVREKRTEAGDASSLDSDTFHMASQYLQESSLSEDFNKYDFSMSGSAQHKSAGQRTRGSLRKKPSYTAPDEKVLVKLEGDFIELEMDELNAHECMPAFIALLKHMQKNNIFPPPQPGVPPKEMPAWMTFLHDKMKSSASDTLNVKLFIGKLIINTAEIFQPFAKFWLRPMCQLILSSGLCDGGINYFIVDLVVTMLSWHDTAIPHDSAEERSMASRLVEFLVAKVYHENRSILRNNLEMLKTLLECWKERIEIPYHEVYNQLKMPDTDSLNSLTGIQVLGVILACKFSPYGPSAPVDRDKFLATLAASMTNKYRQIYPAAAEVIGMVLAHLAEKEMETDGNFHAYIESCLGKVKPDSFIICVHHIQRYYPPIADRFLNKLLFMLPSLHGEFRAQCLEVILNRADSIPNIYLELQSKGLFTFLKHRDETTQTTALRLVYAMAPKLTAKELHSLMTTVTDFNSHPSASCRHIMFDILMWLYDNYRDNVSDEGVEIMKLTKETLLQGLCDEDLACRLIVQNFWSSEIRLPEGTLDRTVAMLEAMYSPGSEQHYLSYSTNLLLEMTSKSPDYQRQIFEHPLSECTFRDYSVQSSWRQRHAVMTPLFAVTQVSQSMDTMEDSVDGQLRSTQEVQQFTATVDPGVKAPFNWLTQSSLDTFADYSMSSTETQSSLLFTVGSNRGGLPKSTNVPRSRLTGPRSGFGQSIPRPISAGKQGSSKNDEDADSNDLWQLKRRFMKDRASSQVYFARRQIRLKKMKEEVLKQQRLRRENQVTLYRKYRIGDLPDIQIQYSAIIAPLQALAQCDATVAKLLFSAVFKAIYQGMDKVKTEREMEEIRNQINTSLNQMLANSTLYYPPLMACVMDIFYNMHASLKVSSMDLGTAAVVSNLQPLGIEVMEEHLIQEESNPRTAKRGRFECASLSQDVPLWYELARLYKSVREYDVLHGIFNGVLNTKEITHRAMVAESHGNFKEAKMLYDEAIECAWEEKPLDVEIDFWDESRMECLNRMTLWKDLESVATDGVRSTESSSLDNVWKDTFSMETYLPYLMRSKLKLMLQGDTTQQSLLTFIDESMKDAEHKAHLENRFSGELALVAVWQSDYGRARHYARLATQQFLQEWSSTDSLLVTARAQILQHLQPLVELQEFLDFMGDGNLTSLQPSFKLTTTWERRSPHLQLDAVDIWDDVITNRNVFLDKISHYVQSSDSLDFDQETDAFQDIKLKFKLKMAESCKEQNNFSLSLKILKETFKKCKQDESKTRLVEWSHLYASLHHKKALSRDGVWTDETLYNVLTTLDQLGKVSDVDLLLQRSDLHLRQSMLTGQAYDVLLTGITETNTLDVLTAKTSEKLKQYAGTLDLDCNKLMQQLVVKGFHAFRNALSDDYESLQSGSSLQQCDLQLELAKYCDKYLRFSEEDETLLSKRTLGSFPETAVKCLLDSMRMGSEEARERFPCLLQIIEQNPDTMGLFIRKADTVPCWMFILWISQMMALMDKPQAPAVRPILLRIAAEYPQAVVYPFHISQEGFTFGSAETDKKNREGVERLADLLSEEKVPWVSKLISALDQFGQPFQLFKDWSDDMQKLLAKSSRSIDVIKTKYQEMYNMLVNIPETATDSLSIESSLGTLSTTILMGDFRRRFAKVFKKDFDVYFGKDGQKLTTMTLKEFCGMFRKVQEQFEKIKDKREMMPPSKIGEYCPWMETFNPNRDGRDLEIPGQYDGLRKPMPEYHVKVAGFDERVLVMSSIRKPKRITIRGNDEKDYHYLVKGGEDLRQDQRIEQLFLQMNKVLQKDPACRSRSLKVKTYQVIPMTPRVGLIEWMNNTCPLKEFLLDAMTDSEKAYFHGEQGPSKQHHKWTSKCQETGKRTHGGMYSLVFQKYSKTETVKEFRIKEGKVPWNLSRRALQQMSTSPEAFHVLRCELLTSHAVLSICQYLLGIGDRHLSNFMINLKTGQMVGIDFGHAFGTATQFLPIPELMAIRLTRQIVNVGLPLKTKGLLENTMVYVLRALRRNHDLLLATMDVFVKEVSVDWKQFAEKQINEGKEPEDAEENVAWYPKQKIMSAARKLKGDNPCCITRDELRLGHGKNPALKAFETVTMGDPQENIRAQLPHTDLNEEDQVAALIDQATDPNILGRTWAGWEPWV